MLTRLKAWCAARNRGKRSLVKRSDFLFTIGLLLLVIGSDYAVNGRYLISDAYLYGQQLFDPQVIGYLTIAVGGFVIVSAWSKKPKLTRVAFSLAAMPFALISAVYAVIAVIDGINAVGFRALMFIVLLRFVWLAAAVVDLPEKERR